MTARLLYPVPEALRLLGIGRTAFYGEVKRGRILIVKSGKKTLVPGRSLNAYEQLLVSEAEAAREQAA